VTVSSSILRYLDEAIIYRTSRSGVKPFPVALGNTMDAQLKGWDGSTQSILAGKSSRPLAEGLGSTLPVRFHYGNLQLKFSRRESDAF